jgi:hypothetical protein
MSLIVGMQHSDLAVFTTSWELALRADEYADNTVRAYQNAVGAWPTGSPSTPSRGRTGPAGAPAHPGLAGRGPRAV